MNGQPWSDLELQELYETVNEPGWFALVYLPGRSPAAIRVRMCQLREEAAIIPRASSTRAAAHDRSARLGSDRLLKALLEVA